MDRWRMADGVACGCRAAAASLHSTQYRLAEAAVWRAVGPRSGPCSGPSCASAATRILFRLERLCVTILVCRAVSPHHRCVPDRTLRLCLLQHHQLRYCWSLHLTPRRLASRQQHESLRRISRLPSRPPSSRLASLRLLPARCVQSAVRALLRHGRGSQHSPHSAHSLAAVRRHLRTHRPSRGARPPVAHSHSDAAADAARGQQPAATVRHARSALLSRRVRV